jgi:hypothetical protein
MEIKKIISRVGQKTRHRLVPVGRMVFLFSVKRLERVGASDSQRIRGQWTGCEDPSTIEKIQKKINLARG